MIGYIFEVTNKKTGETYLGKCYSVFFNKNYFGEDAEPEVQKLGKSMFDVKMIMPYERVELLDEAFEEMKKSHKPLKVATEKEESVEEVKPKRRRTKKSEE